jgi:hypothetical protein
MKKRNPLAIDLFCGLGGWTDGLLAEGYHVIGFDIESHQYGDARYPAQLVLQDVLTLHGMQFKDADLIVASPPCQEYSYMAMPWSKAKAIEDDYKSGVRDVKKLTALFDACFRIQREACEAAGRHIPMVVENVRGAQKWVGRSRWNFGSFHLWGDVPALMPVGSRAQKFNPDGTAHPPGSWFAVAKHEGLKVPGIKLSEVGFNVATAQRYREGIKQGGISGKRENGKGDRWFQDGAAKHGSKSDSRKAASAQIAKIPLPLAQYIAKVYRP